MQDLSVVFKFGCFGVEVCLLIVGFGLRVQILLAPYMRLSIVANNGSHCFFWVLVFGGSCF